MPPARTIARNSIWLALAHFGGKVFSVLLTAIAGRILGTAGFGLYATGAALVEVGRVIAASGLDYLVAREVASEPRSASRVASNAAALKLAGGLGTYLVLLIGVLLLDYSEPVLWVVLVLGSALFLENVSDVLDAVFQGRERMGFTTRAFLISAAVLLVTWAAALLGGLGILGYASAFVVSFLVRLVLMLRYAHRLEIASLRTSELQRSELVRLMRAGVPLLGATVLALIFHRMDLLMLGKLVGASEVGLYAAAVRIVDVVVLLPRVLATAVYPALRREQARGVPAVRALMARSTRISLVLCSLATLGVWILAPYALRIVLGPEFVPASGVLQLLGWGIVLQAGAHLMARLLFSLDAERDFLHIAGISLLCNAGLNLWWIPRMGITGAAWATLTSYVLSLMLYLWAAARRGFALPLREAIFAPAAALGAAALAAWWGRELEAVPQAAVMVAAWALGALVFRAVRREDLAELWEMLRSARASAGPEPGEP